MKQETQEKPDNKALNIVLTISTAVIIGVGAMIVSTVNALNLEVTALRENVKGLNERLSAYSEHSAKLEILGNRIIKLETESEIDNTRTRRNTN